MTARRATQPPRRAPIRNVPAILPVLPLLMVSLWVLAFSCLGLASLLLPHPLQAGPRLAFGSSWAGLLALCGRRCEGRITERWILPEYGMSGPCLCVPFRFAPPAQQPVEAAEVNHRLHARCQCGDPVRVRYVRFWPRICRLV